MAYDSDKLLQRQRLCTKCHSYITYTRIDEGNVQCPLCEKAGVQPKAARAKLSAIALIQTLHKHQNDVGADHPLYNSFEAALDRRMMKFPFDNDPQVEKLNEDAGGAAPADGPGDTDGAGDEKASEQDAKASEDGDEAAS